MTSLLFGISLSALLSTTSLLVVLLRISPLSSPGEAISAFLVSVFLSVGSVAALALYAFWKHFPFHHWDGGKLLTISLRQGILIAFATVTILLFDMLQVLTWWIAAIIILTLLIIEIALSY